MGIRPIEAVDESASFPEAGPTPGRTVSGVQKKLLVVKDGDTYTPAGRNGPAPYIAKFNSKDIDSLVRNEFRSLRWTSAVLGKDEVTEFDLGTVNAESVLIVKRFDRSPNGEKRRLEDFAQILVKPRGNDYDGKYDSDYEAVADAIKKHSVLPVVDLARFYRRLITFALIGNCDAHLKNFSLLETPRGLRLSPVYDVLNTAFYGQYDPGFGLRLLGRRWHYESLDGAVFREFGKAIGLKDRLIEATFTGLKKQVEKARDHLIPPSGEGPDGFVTRFAEIVSNQCQRILGE